MIVMKAPNEELQKAVLEDSERLHKEAEEALEANRKEAEEIEKYHGEDTKKPVSNKALKALHLSEALFEDLNPEESSNFRSDIYYAIQRVCYLYRFDGVSPKDLEDALEWTESHFRTDEDFDECFLDEKELPREDVPGFEGTWDAWDKLDASVLGESLTESTSTANIWLVQGMFNQAKDLGLEKEAVDILYDRGIGITKDGTCIELPKSACTGAYIDLKNLIDGLNESLNEELSQQGQKILNELKKELGPELQKKVAFVIKDYASKEKNTKPEVEKKQPKEEVKEKSQEEDVKESLSEDLQDMSFEVAEEKKILDALESNHIYPTDLGVHVRPDGATEVTILIHLGDWKHEHWACHDIMSDLGYVRTGSDEEDNGTDTYSATHHYIKMD